MNIYKKVLFSLKILFIVLISATILTVVILLATHNPKQINRRKPYDKTGFKKYNEISTPLKLSNDRFEFEIDKNNTNFKVFDKSTGETWHSNPVDPDISNRTTEMFVIYSDRLASISQKYAVDKKELKNKNFYFRFLDNNKTIEVLYEVNKRTGITIDDLPKQIPAEKYETKIDAVLKNDKDYRIYVKSSYVKYDNLGCYVLNKTISNPEVITKIHELIFKKSKYTKNDYIEDSKFYNIKIKTAEDFDTFEFSVKYTLDKNGLNVKLVNDSIYENSKFPFSYIDVLPFFGSKNKKPGFTVIPDGSGIIINHDNNKYGYLNYEKRIYGNDYSKGFNEEKIKEQTKINMPMYGFNNGDKSFFNSIESGSSMTNILFGFRYDEPNVVPYTYYRYFLREKDSFTFSNTNQYETNKWTTDYNTLDFSFTYNFIEKNHTYNEIAKKYQEYLVSKNLLIKRKINDFNLNYDILGSVLIDSDIMGVKTKKLEVLTSFNDLDLIRKKSFENNLNNINFNYIGWINNGVKANDLSKFRYNSKVISKKDILNIYNYELNNNVNINFNVSLSTGYANKYLSSHYISKTLYQNKVLRYDYDISTNLYDKTTTPRYFYNYKGSKLIKNSIKNNLKYNNMNLTINDIGNILNSDFSSKETIFRYQTLIEELKILESLSEFNLSFSNPNLYVYKFADKIYNLKTFQETESIVDYSIPFIHLVLNGYVNYYNESINLNDNKSITYHILKALETGANVSYTISYADNKNLIDSEFSKYFQVNFDKQFSNIKKVYEILNKYNFSAKKIISHKVLNRQGTNVEVVYENGSIINIDYENNKLIISGEEITI